MNNDSTRDLKEFYEIVDWFRSAETSGGKVELLIAPRKENADERVITIGFNGGTSRDQVSFLVSDGDYFDATILPKILEYYGTGDKYIENYSISKAELIGQTSKATLETEGGNLVYLETYNPELLEEVTENLDKKEETLTTLTEYQKEWREIINCVKSRREVAQKYASLGLSLEEVGRLSQVASFLSSLPEFTPGYSEVSKKKIEHNLRTLLQTKEYDEELRKIGIGEVQYQQWMDLLGQDLAGKRILRNDDIIMAWVKNIQAEKRINKSIEKNSMTPDGYSKKKYDQYVERLEFATRELGKRTVNFYHLTNAPYEQFEIHENDQNYGKNCPGAVAELKRSYEEKNQQWDQEKIEQYTTYCDELLDYFKQKAKMSYERRKATIKDKTNITFVPYSKKTVEKEEIEDETKENKDTESFENLMNSIELCKKARVGNENFEMIIEQDDRNPTKRYVRVALFNGVSRQDSFYFEFEDGQEFDRKIGEVVSKTLQEDKISKFTKIPVLDAEGEETALLTTQDGNEILFKVSQELNEEVEEFLREKVNDTMENLASEDSLEQMEPIEPMNQTAATEIPEPSPIEIPQEQKETTSEKSEEEEKDTSPELKEPVPSVTRESLKQQIQYGPKEILRTGWMLASVLEKREHHVYNETVDYGKYAKERDVLNQQKDYYEGQLTYMLNPDYTDFFPMAIDDEVLSQVQSPTEEELNPSTTYNQDLMTILLELAAIKKQLSETTKDDEQNLLRQKIKEKEIGLIQWRHNYENAKTQNATSSEEKQPETQAKKEVMKKELSMEEKCYSVVEQLKEIARKQMANPKKENAKQEEPTKTGWDAKIKKDTNFTTKENKSVIERLKELRETVVNNVKQKLEAVAAKIREWLEEKNKEDWIQLSLVFNPEDTVDFTVDSTLPASEKMTQKYTRDETFHELIPMIADMYTENNEHSEFQSFIPQEKGQGKGALGQCIIGSDNTVIYISGNAPDVLKATYDLKNEMKKCKKRRQTKDESKKETHFDKTIHPDDLEKTKINEEKPWMNEKTSDSIIENTTEELHRSR